MNPQILDTDARVIFFPVRHHSPTAGRIFRALAAVVKPSAILIEGPADFNDRLQELWLDHTLPIAIYSYAIRQDGTRRGAFYPYCIYSPEWQAIDEAKRRQSGLAFIDLPWGQMINSAKRTHRYSDEHLRDPDYAAQVCKKFGVDDFDGLWERIIESDSDITVEQYLERCHRICYYMRACSGDQDAENFAREQYMGAAIKEWSQRTQGRIIVMTGGFHSHALFDRFYEIDSEFTKSPAVFSVQHPPEMMVQALALKELADESEAHGIALTPYSYPLLDSLTGYNAGMPGPGFYHQAYEDSLNNEQNNTYRKLLFQAVDALRKQKQQVSPADVIAVEQTAIALSAIRGQKAVWRLDLIDAVIGALVKDEQSIGIKHPMELALHEVFRGTQRGALAAGTSLPPLVADIQKQLEACSLELPEKRRLIHLNLEKEKHAKTSQLLHRLAQLNIAGFAQSGSTGLEGNEDGLLQEEWILQWTPEFEADCITAAIYGASLEEAATNRLTDGAKAAGSTSVDVASLVADACLMGLDAIGEELRERLVDSINADPEFASVAEALAHLVFIIAYDRVFKTKPALTIGTLIEAAYNRALWLLDILGQATGEELRIAKGISALIEAYERCSNSLNLDKALLLEILKRASQNQQQAPTIRGALIGALWVLGETSLENLRADLQYFRTPEQLGDFLAGLFLQAHDVIQRETELLVQIDSFIMSYDDDEFLLASPALRLAFTRFTPHEKNKMALSILRATESTAAGSDQSPEEITSVDSQTAAEIMAFESRIKKTLKKFGLRGGDI